MSLEEIIQNCIDWQGVTTLILLGITIGFGCVLTAGGFMAFRRLSEAISDVSERLPARRQRRG